MGKLQGKHTATIYIAVCNHSSTLCSCLSSVCNVKKHPGQFITLLLGSLINAFVYTQRSNLACLQLQENPGLQQEHPGHTEKINLQQNFCHYFRTFCLCATKIWTKKPKLFYYGLQMSQHIVCDSPMTQKLFLINATNTNHSFLLVHTSIKHIMIHYH